MCSLQTCILTSIINTRVQFDHNWATNDLFKKVTRRLFSAHGGICSSLLLKWTGFPRKKKTVDEIMSRPNSK